MKKHAYTIAYSLLEVLGAVSLLALVTTVSLTSVKDSLAASQRSAIQRELQTLNTALQNYRSAGGEIAPEATAADALRQLGSGVGLGSSRYTPLVDSPPDKLSIAGEDYDLVYDSSNGFIYAKAGAGPSTHVCWSEDLTPEPSDLG